MFYEKVLKAIANTWPDQMPEQLPYTIPAWNDKVAWAKESLKVGKIALSAMTKAGMN